MGKHVRGRDDPADFTPEQSAHPSQAEGEDPEQPGGHPDPATPGHPSQAEGEDDGRSEE